MGREATSRCVLGDSSDETVRALLESKELILRGVHIRHRWPLTVVRDVRALDDQLRFLASGMDVTLYLGDKEAAAWARKMTTPPPTLVAKLGLSAAAPALVIGNAVDDALVAALEGATTRDAGLASQLVAIVLNDADLMAALALHADMACRHVWMVHRKGKGAELGDTAIRAALRTRGYVDTKISAVSDSLSATRYTLRSRSSVAATAPSASSTPPAARPSRNAPAAR